MKDPKWQHADRVGDIGDISSKIFYRMSIRKIPLGSISGLLFARDAWNICNESRRLNGAACSKCTLRWDRIGRRRRETSIVFVGAGKTHGPLHFRRRWVPLPMTIGVLSRPPPKTRRFRLDSISLLPFLHPLIRRIPIFLRPRVTTGMDL